jgi:hypothetical protein
VIAVRDRLGQPGLLLVVAEPEEHGALLHRLPFLEAHVLDHAAGLGLELDRVLGVELTAEGRRIAQQLRLDLEQLDGDRRLFGGGSRPGLARTTTGRAEQQNGEQEEPESGASGEAHPGSVPNRHWAR